MISYAACGKKERNESFRGTFLRHILKKPTVVFVLVGDQKYFSERVQNIDGVTYIIFSQTGSKKIFNELQGPVFAKITCPHEIERQIFGEWILPVIGVNKNQFKLKWRKS